jgi:hypothetical protein
MSDFRAIELSMDTFFLSIDKITSISSQQVVAETKVEYTVAGSATARGVLHQPRYIWEITALLTESESELLRGMQITQDRKRRQLLPCGIALVDRTQRFVQPVPATRAIAPGDTPIVTGAIVAYFAAFSVLITSPKLQAAGKYFASSFTAMEIENIA